MEAKGGHKQGSAGVKCMEAKKEEDRGRGVNTNNSLTQESLSFSHLSLVAQLASTRPTRTKQWVSCGGVAGPSTWCRPPPASADQNNTPIPPSCCSTICICAVFLVYLWWCLAPATTGCRPRPADQNNSSQLLRRSSLPTARLGRVTAIAERQASLHFWGWDREKLKSLESFTFNLTAIEYESKSSGP